MILISYLVFLIAAFYFSISFVTIIKMLIYTVLVSILFLNIKCIFLGFTFFARDARQLAKIHRALEDLVWNKPEDIFPDLLKSFLIFVIPYLLIGSYLFTIIRNKDSIFFWLLTIAWTILAMITNHLVWQQGLKRYESFG